MTPREQEVLVLLADGLTNAEIARALWISEETVKTHVRRVLSKLGARTRTGAVGVAFRAGILLPQPHPVRVPPDSRLNGVGPLWFEQNESWSVRA